MDVRIPAAPARAEPRPKVKEITTSVLTPIREATSGLKESARIAIPKARVEDDCAQANKQKKRHADDDQLPAVIVSAR
jgi:hypothetical protein